MAFHFAYNIANIKYPQYPFIIFMILSIIGLLLNTLIVYVTIDVLHWWSLLAKVIATGIVMVFNFITRKMFLEKRATK